MSRWRYLPLSLIGMTLLNCGIDAIERRAPAKQVTEDDDGSQSERDADVIAKEGEGGTTGDGTQLNEVDGKQFFLQTVVPALRKDCASCHAEPRENPPMAGPLSIYSYAAMKAMLETGGHPLDNSAISKPLGRGHAGGKRCANENSSPCRELTEWWAFEFELSQTPLRAQVSRIGLTGEVVGWALNLDDALEVVTIRPFMNGDETTGEALPDVVANTLDYDNNAAGNHGFRFTVPAKFATGDRQTLNLYAVVDSKLQLLTPRALDLYAYLPRQAGRDYYQNNIAGTLQNSCGNCHRIAYDQQYAALSSPAPHLGGSTTNNDLVRYASGGNNHRGGNFCGNGTAGVCALFAQWWNLEFP